MKEHIAHVVSNQQGITARVCPRGVVVLSIGHTSLALWRRDFLRLARVMHAAARQVDGQHERQPGERPH